MSFDNTNQLMVQAGIVNLKQIVLREFLLTYQIGKHRSRNTDVHGCLARTTIPFLLRWRQSAWNIFVTAAINTYLLPR